MKKTKEAKTTVTKATNTATNDSKTKETKINEANEYETKTDTRRNYKDTIFRMIFREKENLLSLYNALNGTAYGNVDDLEITTLENAVYMNYKNDISFVFAHVR